MARIILANCGNGYCGCDAKDIFLYDDDTVDKEIDIDIFNWAVDTAESYAYVHFGWGEPYTDEEYEDYIENYVTYGWEEIPYAEYCEWCKNWGYDPIPITIN